MSRRGLLLLLSALVFAWLATGFFQVRPGELAVVRRCGAVFGEPRGPGLHFGLPWGLDQVDRVAVDAQRELPVGYQDAAGPDDERLAVGQLLTGDNNLLNLRLTVYWRVDPRQVVRFSELQERLEPTLRRLAEETMLATVSGARIDPILYGQARALEDTLRRRLAERAGAYALGVLIEQVNVNFAQPPSDLSEAFREVNRARTRREIAEREAQSLKSREVSLARQDAEAIRSEGAAGAAARKTQARAEAAEFLVRLRALPTDPAARRQALFSLYLARMQEVLGKLQIRAVSGDTDQTVVLPPAGREP